jgi:hypothetical protein
MTISVIDNSQRTAAKVAGIALLFSMVIVVFANYGLLQPASRPRQCGRNRAQHHGARGAISRLPAHRHTVAQFADILQIAELPIIF